MNKVIIFVLIFCYMVIFPVYANSEGIKTEVTAEELQELYPQAYIEEINLLNGNNELDEYMEVDDIGDDKVCVSDGGAANQNPLNFTSELMSGPRFSCDLFPVFINGKWGYVNTLYDLGLIPMFDSVEPFKFGRAWVTKDDQRYQIDSNGNKVKQLELPELPNGELYAGDASSQVSYAIYNKQPENEVPNYRVNKPQYMEVIIGNSSTDNVYSIRTDHVFGHENILVSGSAFILEDRYVIVSLRGNTFEAYVNATFLVDSYNGNVLGENQSSLPATAYSKYGNLIFTNQTVDDHYIKKEVVFRSLDLKCRKIITPPEGRVISANCNQNFLVILVSNLIQEYDREGYIAHERFIPETMWIVADKTKLDQAPQIDYNRVLEMNGSSIFVLLNEKQLEFDVAPQKENDRVLVPLRTIFEALGAEMSWNDERQQVTARREEITVELTIGEEKMLKNDEVIQLDVPAKLVKDRTLIPIRAAAEAFGAKVEWNEGTQTVIIETN